MAPKKETTAGKKDEKPDDDSKKRKAEAKAEAKAEPKKAAKKETKKDEVKEEVEPKEKEQDAAADKRTPLKQTVSFEPNECTLNVLPTLGGKVLNSLQDGGMQYLIAGARANVGIQTGRYMYEVRVVEALSPTDTSGGRGRPPLPRQLLRIGFSTSASSLVLGEDAEGVCFDAEGKYRADRTSVPSLSQRFGKDMVVACLLNLDEKSPNFNTISLFKNGERICEPQVLPEILKGKALFPHVSFRNITVQVNFGVESLAALPFKCRMLQSAAQADVTVTPPMTTSKDGKYEVLFPVSFPDQGTFAWLDMFLEKNPGYVELSDRRIIEWAEKSGLWKPKGAGFKNSNDKPEFNYGLPSMDDFSVRRVLNAVAPLVPRNYVVMEVKENLVAGDRKANLKRFNHPSYRKVANVVMGEPTNEYKSLIHDRLLQVKKDKAENEWKAKKAEKERKKQLGVKQKQLAALRKKAEAERQKAKEEAQKKLEEAQKKAEEEAKKKAEEEAKEKAEEGGEKVGEGAKEELKKEDEVKDEEVKEETKEEVKEEETKEEDTKEEEKDDEEDDEPMPDVELTEEEKKSWFPKQDVPDLTSQMLNQAFGKFTVPDKSEGFDEVRFEWQKKDVATSFLRNWVLERKVTSKIEDLEPSEWFKSKHSNFEKKLKEWQEKQKPFLQKKEDKKKSGEDEDDKGEDIDIFSVDDVTNIGNGNPLFKEFGFEDWALLSLRYELFLLVHAFMKDVGDEERVGIHESNLNFYYNKYYKKTLTPKHYGKDTNSGLIEFVKDTVTIEAEKSVLASQLADDADTLDIFVKLTEESRRERQRRIDAGDETARLHFSVLMTQQNLPKAQAKVQGGPPEMHSKGQPWKGKGYMMGGKGGYGGKW